MATSPPIDQAFLQEVRDTIANGRVDKAIDSLLGTLDKHPHLNSQYEEVLLLSQRYQELLRQKRLGNDDPAKLNQIPQHLLTIVNQLESLGQPGHKSKLGSIVADLRSRMLTASGEHELKKLQFETAQHIQKHPDSFELVELKNKIDQSLEFYSRTPPTAAPQQRRRSVAWVLSLLLLVTLGGLFYLLWDNSSEPQLAMAIENDQVQINGLADLEAAQQTELLAMAETANTRMAYRNQLANANQVQLGKMSANASGNYARIKQALTTTNAQLQTEIEQLEQQLLDSLDDRDLLFDYNSFKLKEASKEQLAAIAEQMQRGPMIQLELTGHTDDTGTDTYNRRLSQKRAHTAATFLRNRAISLQRLSTQGKGEANPKVANTDDDSRQQNRRVELEFSINK